jgi:hypothetical protein
MVYAWYIPTIKWHPIFQGVVKARKGHRLLEYDVQDIDSQDVDASYL